MELLQYSKYILLSFDKLPSGNYVSVTLTLIHRHIIIEKSHMCKWIELTMHNHLVIYYK